MKSKSAWVFIVLLVCSGPVVAQTVKAGETAPGVATRFAETMAAAKRGDPNAQLDVARAYVLGQGVKQDAVQATYWLNLAAEQGHVEAQYLAGKGLSGTNEEGRERASASWYRRAAYQGHADAQYQLALAFLQGRRGSPWPSNGEEAIALLRASANAGVAEAQLTLGSVGMMKAMEDPTNVEWAGVSFPWIKRAAEQGLADAQLILATYYQAGKAVPQDFVQAHMWANIAASKGATNIVIGSAADLRERIAKQMTPSQLERAQELASIWKPRPERQ